MLGPCKIALEVTNNIAGGFLDVTLSFTSEDDSQVIASEHQKVYPNCTAYIGPFGMVMHMNGAELFVPIQSFVKLPADMVSDSLFSESRDESFDQSEM